MKKSLIYFAALSFLISSAAFADSTVTSPVAVEKNVPSFVEYHNRMSVFSPAHQTYERTKTNDLYAGVEVWAVETVAASKGHSVIGQAEFRLGYNYFCHGRDHLTPHAGVGAFRDFKKIHYNGETHRKPVIVYGEIGFIYDHEFNTIFNLGFNAKALVGGSTKHGDSHARWGSAVYGVDVSLPITFRFGRHRHWDYRIEPFNTYMHGSATAINYFGFRNTLGYRF